MTEDQFGGQSLRFVRKLLRCPAKWATAQDAAKDLPLITDEPPEFGSVCFYGPKLYGHCGVYVNDQMCLTVNSDGRTRLLPYDDEHYWGGPYLGWISSEDFALSSEAS